MPRHRVSADARAIAHEILVRVETGDAFADRLLADRASTEALSADDRGLLTRLVYGTLAWQGRLDHHLRGLVRVPLERLDAPVRAALRLGLYQLLFLDRVPAYAAVDSSVRLARRRGATLVNAVLRRAAATGRAGLRLPDAAGDRLERLAIEWSHPRWLVQRWAREFGAELPALLAADNEPGPTTVRVNRLRTTREAALWELSAAGMEAEPGRWAPDAIVVSRRAGNLRTLPAWRQGRLTFQGEASQLVTQLLGIAPGDHVLDACAAPGGKAGHAAACTGDGGLVVALDVRPAGARRIRGEAVRLGAAALRVAVADARRLPLRTSFDRILLDAPCTGLGTLRRHPELRWRRRPEDVPRLAALQRELLAAVARHLRPGGILVYAVCTLTPEETEEAIADLVARDPRFAVEPALVADVPAELVTPAGFLRTLPHRHGLDGFFAARLRLDSARPLG
jgi:16S rRNA (cytosine967-C5)-methyltransferase